MKKIIAVVGARPNFMKIAPIYRAFQKYKEKIDFKICHTGQHYDPKMSDAFFNDLNLPYPDFFLNVGSASHAEQTARIMVEFEKILLSENPELVIVVGDVNSTMAATLAAKKLNMAVAHVEGGLRSHDREMPEEINRIVTDSICDYCFITEEDGRENLIKENFPAEKIFFTGNTMIDSLVFAKDKIVESKATSNLGLNSKEFVLMTLHRPSNVDDKEQLTMLCSVIEYIAQKKQVVFPIHPRTRKNIENYNLSDKIAYNVILTEPLGYIDFQNLLLNCDFVITDSGGLQEESTFLGVNCITLRNSTERPVTCTVGTNILIQPKYEDIILEINKILNGNRKQGRVPELWDGLAANRITDIIVNEILN